VVIFAALEFFTDRSFKKLLLNLYPNQILFELNAFELTIFKNNKVEHVIHSVVNALIKSNKIRISDDKKLLLKDANPTGNLQKDFIISKLKDGESVYYAELVKSIVAKPLFQQYRESTNKIRKFITQSKEYQRVVLASLLVMRIFLAVGICRLFLGFIHEKNILFLLFTLIIFAVVSHYFLKRVKNYFFSNILVSYYEEEITEKKALNVEWKYVFLGSLMLVSEFQPLVKYTEKPNNGDGGSSSSCGGTSGGDGGGCGGGCGGCGGGGD
jgi:uncharacterized membrane protein YgcG